MDCCGSLWVVVARCGSFRVLVTTNQNYTQSRTLVVEFIMPCYDYKRRILSVFFG